MKDYSTLFVLKYFEAKFSVVDMLLEFKTIKAMPIHFSYSFTMKQQVGPESIIASLTTGSEV